MSNLNNCCVPTPSQEDLDRRLSVEQLFELQNELNEIVVKGWTGSVSESMLQTAMTDEFSEMIGHGVDWKWWKSTDPATFDLFAVKVEAVDVAHFYLSLMIMDYLRSLSRNDSFCVGDDLYDQFRIYYVGTDKSPYTVSVGILSGNHLRHDAYIRLKDALFGCDGVEHDVFSMIVNLSWLVSSVGMTSEEFSAIYTAKHELNVFRQSEGYQTGQYVKVEDGVEDNERLEPLVQEFLDDPMMTLADLRQNVRDAFYEAV